MKEIYQLKDLPVFSPGCNGGLMVVVDTTGSMSGIMNTLKKFLIHYLKDAFEGQIVRVGLVCMGDHGEELPAVAFSGTTSDWGQYQHWLGSMPPTHGGDDPEAVACAVAAAREVDPEASIWLVTDTIGHDMWFRSSRKPRCYGNGDKTGCGKPLNLEGVNVLLTTYNAELALTRAGHYRYHGSGPVIYAPEGEIYELMKKESK